MNTLHKPDRKRSAERAWTVGILIIGSVLTVRTVQAQVSPSERPSDALHQLNDSIEALALRVSPSVVQIVVSGYSSTEATAQGQTSLVIGKQRTIGSGVIVDPDGYIVTNAHVVREAEKIEVIVPPSSSNGTSLDEASAGREQTYDGRLVGIAQQLDLAVIKIDGHNLPSLPIHKDVLPKQGELVFAFGSPEGLPNSVTMGVVSAVARQPDPDSPQVYIQTDTPINPGNSGGPLVNADAEFVGINTFILSTSGGNQGLGFAIPAGVVAYAYPQLLKYGHIHEPEIGALLQTITPELAGGLQLKRDFGVIVSDLTPGGPAEQAGLKIEDIILSVDGTPTETLPIFGQTLYMHGSGETVKVGVLRGSERLQLDIPLEERPHKVDSLVDTVDPIKNLVRRLGILGIEVNRDLISSLPELRIQTGIVVAAKALETGAGEVPLQTGDVIHTLNGTSITTLADLRQALDKLKPGDPVVLQVERFGQLVYVSFVL